ncbi:hypothetical protein [Haloarcula litorea]|uniref:hypothetical protein n=1 Tax=Haloarcula litorea TaxID=3032579 RepID=UPI0023E8196B|nr:hypothetical protein [Halomicroarcula sp. GDY20]
MKVKPVEAPKKLNKKVLKASGYRPLNLDKTHDDNRDFHTDSRWVRVDGEKHLMYGIIGRPRNTKKREILAYIYDLSDDQIRKYSGDIHDPEGRINPFKGKYSWLQAEGVTAKRKESGRGNKIEINQGPPREEASSEGN